MQEIEDVINTDEPNDDAMFLQYLLVNSKDELLQIYNKFIFNSLKKREKKQSVTPQSITKKSILPPHPFITNASIETDTSIITDEDLHPVNKNTTVNTSEEIVNTTEIIPFPPTPIITSTPSHPKTSTSVKNINKPDPIIDQLSHLEHKIVNLYT